MFDRVGRMYLIVRTDIERGDTLAATNRRIGLIDLPHATGGAMIPRAQRTCGQ